MANGTLVCLSLATVLPDETRRQLTAPPAKERTERTSATNERYQRLFESMGHGFCIAQMLFDASGNPVDYRILEGNTEFKRLTGLWNIGDRTVRQALPDLEFWWSRLTDASRSLEHRKRFEYYAAPM